VHGQREQPLRSRFRIDGAAAGDPAASIYVGQEDALNGATHVLAGRSLLLLIERGESYRQLLRTSSR
jgi:hypothetical protein